MTEWAEREVAIACKKENPKREPGEWDYGCACYESALKAYKSLMEDEHSGFSFGVTKNILIRLLNEKPLTPIEDTPDAWNAVTRNLSNNSLEYQCKRMSSLFKNLYSDGSVKYHDINRTCVVYVNNPTTSWHSGFASRMIDEMFPITMPYNPPSKGYTVYCEDFLVDPAKGDYDTVGYLYAIDPEGEKIVLNRYYKEDNNHQFVEIDREEYCERKLAAHDI
jgi:hypothetical protein